MKVSVILGSKSDSEVAKKVVEVFEKEGIPYDLKVLSAHRNPEELDEYIKKCESDVIIAIAGLSAALPGVIASKTDKPVILAIRDPLNRLPLRKYTHKVEEESYVLAL